MTARKPAHREPIDWVKIINALGTVTVMVMMAFFSVKQNHMGTEVAQVKKQTDGARTASLLAVSISARSLAAVTKLPADVKTAEEAEAAYKVQLEIQQNSERQ